jgi:predicted esterase
MQIENNPPESIEENHDFLVPVECYFILQIPKQPPDLMFLALHGYGMTARTMLDLSKILLGSGRLIASLQAPFAFYLQQNQPKSPVGYNWGTRDHGTANIQLHHNMIRLVRRQLEDRFGIPAKRTILLGFSQPVGFNYRFAATHPDEIGGVIGICGGVPKDWESGNYLNVSCPLLHIARKEDEFFPESVTSDYKRKLSTRANDVEFHLLPGGHKFPSQGGPIVQSWLQRVMPATG